MLRKCLRDEIVNKALTFLTLQYFLNIFQFIFYFCQPYLVDEVDKMKWEDVDNPL